MAGARRQSLLCNGWDLFLGRLWGGRLVAVRGDVEVFKPRRGKCTAQGNRSSKTGECDKAEWWYAWAKVWAQLAAVWVMARDLFVDLPALGPLGAFGASFERVPGQRLRGGGDARCGTWKRGVAKLVMFG
ncbi:hypothetical protein BD779DRAFT_1475973 [Infundibulicybe gibba]|nr:hypothetical protein BD779DRAFT_1475973 [Infundibulicybe gibba]